MLMLQIGDPSITDMLHRQKVPSEQEKSPYTENIPKSLLLSMRVEYTATITHVEKYRERLDATGVSI